MKTHKGGKHFSIIACNLSVHSQYQPVPHHQLTIELGCSRLKRITSSYQGQQPAGRASRL